MFFQVHKQSLGKAAAKQARTLDLEFTVSRRTENKTKSGRRQHETPSNSERGATAVPNGRENPPAGPSTPVEVATADIDNPQEFPSLSTGQEAVTQGGKANSRNDSLAQKLAKGYRFNVRNTDGTHNEEFPSLAPAHNLRPSEAAAAAISGRPQIQSNGTQRSIQVKVTSAGPSTEGSSTRNGKQSSSVSVQLTKKYQLPPQGAGPPVPRITKVSSSQNIQIQSSLPLQRESDFPSLVSKGPQPQELSKLETSWGKKDKAKPPKKSSNQQPVVPPRSKPQIQAQEDFPSLVPSSKLKSDPIPKAKNNAHQASENKPKPQPKPNIVADAADSFKGKGTKKKANSKFTDDDDTSAFQSVTERKIAELQYGEIRSLSSRMGGTTLDLGAVASTSERKNLAESKLSLIKPSDLKPSEVNGVKPKVKSKPSFNTTEFPALSSAPQVTQSFFEENFNTPVARFPENKTTTTNQASKPNSSKNKAEVPPPLNSTARSFLPPNDFPDRNHQLISTISDLLCSNDTKFSQFRTASSQFRNRKLEAKQYYSVIQLSFLLESLLIFFLSSELHGDNG